jgi:hypothetical protein
MNNDHQPKMVGLALPADTIEHTVDRVLVAMMAVDDTERIGHFLVVNSDFGCYKFRLTDDATASLLAQCVAQYRYGQRLLQQQEGEEE